MSTRRRVAVGGTIFGLLLLLVIAASVGDRDHADGFDRFASGLPFFASDAEARDTSRAASASSRRSTDVRADGPSSRRSLPAGGIEDPFDAREAAAPRELLPLTDAALERIETLGPSQVSDVHTDVSLENTCLDPVEVFWIDTEGRERSYGRLVPGARENFGTFVGHNWHVRSLDGALLRGLAAEADGARWVTCDPTHVLSRGEPIERAFDPEWPEGESPATLEAADIVVENTCADDIQIRWVDFDGAERDDGTLAPGERWPQHSFYGHLWRIRDAEGRTIGEFRASAGATYATCADRPM